MWMVQEVMGLFALHLIKDSFNGDVTAQTLQELQPYQVMDLLIQI